MLADSTCAFALVTDVKPFSRLVFAHNSNLKLFSILLFSLLLSCASGGESWLLPSSHSDHIRRIVVSSFLPPPSDSPTAMAKGGWGHPEDPEVPHRHTVTSALSASGCSKQFGTSLKKTHIDVLFSLSSDLLPVSDRSVPYCSWWMHPKLHQ